jgi:hypothetical protein
METVIIGLGMATVVGLLMFALVMAFDLNKLINKEAQQLHGGELTKFKTKGEK